MIEHECPVCWSQGPHRVVQDTGQEVDAVCADCGCVMNVVLYDNKQEVPTEQRIEMAAIQTYEARAIREGYHAYLGLHHGTVLRAPEVSGPGTVEITIRCEYHPDEEEIFPVPAHSAVHAERAL